MSVTSAIVLFAVCWFMILFIVLPLYIRSQEEAGHVEPGTPAGAPDQPMIKKKLIWTTIAAAIAWAILFTIITSGVITVEDIAKWTGRPE
ncbi:MAG: DUF1467 family protein [Pseudomonadota bacterium]